jgi:hypothetical protein
MVQRQTGNNSGQALHLFNWRFVKNKHLNFVLNITCILSVNDHITKRNRLDRSWAARLLLSVVYVLFFSVQICFRYTSDASYASDLEAIQAKANQVHSLAGTHGSAVVHLSGKTGSHSYLNKRYEPVSVMDVPLQTSLVHPFPSAFTPKGYPRNEHGFTHPVLSTSLRGPPTPAV